MFYMVYACFLCIFSNLYLYNTVLFVLLCVNKYIIIMSDQRCRTSANTTVIKIDLPSLSIEHTRATDCSFPSLDPPTSVVRGLY